MKKAEIPIRNLAVEVEMEVLDKQKMQSKTVDLLNRESVNDELFDSSRLLEDVLERDNMLEAMYRVIRNKGSHGVDGMKTDELREHVKRTWATVRSKLLEGKYNPSPVRRVEIPKPDGGVRLLGIPTVQDRMIQQAIAQILSKIYEPTFSESSFGFRPGRGAKNAIKQSETYINEGDKWVVDKELEKRGHKFCRYADDCNIYVRSKKAGFRVMDSITRIIEGKLKLKVNRDKSAVDIVSKRKFLGFSFYFVKGGAKIRIHEKSIKRFK